MRTPIKQLSANERELLALLYEKDDYKVLRKLISFMKSQYAEQHVGQTDLGQVRYLTGMVGSLNQLMVIIQDNFKEVNKPDKKS